MDRAQYILHGKMDLCEPRVELLLIVWYLNHLMWASCISTVKVSCKFKRALWDCLKDNASLCWASNLLSFWTNFLQKSNPQFLISWNAIFDDLCLELHMKLVTPDVLEWYQQFTWYYNTSLESKAGNICLNRLSDKHISLCSSVSGFISRLNI